MGQRDLLNSLIPPDSLAVLSKRTIVGKKRTEDTSTGLG